MPPPQRHVAPLRGRSRHRWTSRGDDRIRSQIPVSSSSLSCSSPRTSLRDTIPTTTPSSTTGTWRNPPSRMSRNASIAVARDGMDCGARVMTSRRRVFATSFPFASVLTTSRPVKMPTRCA